MAAFRPCISPLKSAVASDLTPEVAVVRNTIKSWLSLLQTSGVIFYLESCLENMRKRIVKSRNLYVADSGLLDHPVGAVNAGTGALLPLAGALSECHPASS